MPNWKCSNADEKRSIEGRCDGLSVQFQAAKVGGSCDHGKHPSKGGKHADRQLDPAANQPESAEGVDHSIEDPQPNVGYIQLPGARRSLASHHDKHSKKHSDKGKHHDGENGEHSDRHSKRDSMTFEDVEGKLCVLCGCLYWHTEFLSVSISGMLGADLLSFGVYKQTVALLPIHFLLRLASLAGH